MSALYLPASLVSTTLTTANTVAFGIAKNMVGKEIEERKQKVRESEKQKKWKKVDTIGGTQEHNWEKWTMFCKERKNNYKQQGCYNGYGK